MGAFGATRTIASLTLMRVFRGRALWVSGAIAMLPIFFAYMLRDREGSELATGIDIFAFEQLVLAVLPALLVAASVGEEIEDRTTTYLWSRPVPRWTVLAGKLLAMVPIIWALSIASWCTAMLVATEQLPGYESCLALAIGATALSVIAASIATLVPRYGMALSICYMLFFDLPLGGLPAAIENVSVTRHTRVIAEMVSDLEDSRASAAIGLATIALLWAVVGLWRIRRLEA
jgi:ABC-type transport system involved in multi-copper enzyme maturation permease subunit